MVLRDVAGVVARPGGVLPEIAEGRPLPVAATVVVAAGIAAGALSALSVGVEPASDQAGGVAAGIAVSVALPVLFAGIWVADALVIDAVARLMGCPKLRRGYLATSAYAVPLLTLFEVVRLLQAVIDRTAGSANDASTALGFVEFALLAWFVVVLVTAVRAVYGLAPLNALAAALAPYALVAALLVVVLIVASVLNGAGVG